MSEMQIPILEQTKECWKCKVTLPLDCFAKRGKGLRRGGCRTCNKLTDSPIKKLSKEQKEKYGTYPKTEEQREKIREYQRSEKVRQRIREYQRSEKHKKYISFKLKTDLQFKLTKILRCRLKDAIKNKQKIGSAVNDLGCSVDFLIIYLESKFTKGMNWDNRGFNGWHIDHIIPLASFDLTDREQFLKACHYTNLQPLWAKDNLSKGKKFSTG